ncbi:Gypsy retrotransposon integrase-like protein 1, partial [Elysia marginata]
MRGGSPARQSNPVPHYDRRQSRRRDFELQSPDRRKTTLICFYCNEAGHTKKECFRRARELGLDQGMPQVVCNYCGKTGHYRSQCTDLNRGKSPNYGNKQLNGSVAAVTDYMPLSNDLSCALIGVSGFNRNGNLTFEPATVNGHDCSLLRDSGCDTVAVAHSLVSSESLTGRTVRVRTFCCEERVFPTAIIDLQSQYFSGRVEACVLENPIADIILGNIMGIKSLHMDSAVANPVKTRAQDKNHPDAGPNACSNDNVENTNLFERFADFVQRQKKDPTLELWFTKVGAGPVDGVSFVIADNLLYRDFVKDDVTYRTLAVPQSLRDQVLSYAHEATLTAHAGYNKTLHCIQSQFSWPYMTTDVRNYVKSCHVCQMKAPAGRDKPAPFQRMPLMKEPFQRVVIDLVGPLPFTKEKYEYILTMIDVSTRWAEATPLRQTTADKVAEALFDIFTRVGFPKEIQSDRGQQFMSKLLQEFNSLSSIKHIFSTPYHPQTNGVVERFHSTLKNMLRKLADQSPSDWN